MLTIDRLRLTLPPGFESRADAVARLVADELAARPLRADPSGDRRVDRLSVPSVTAPVGGTDREVARVVARAVHGELMRGGG